MGVVAVTLEDANHVAIDNVPSYRSATAVAVKVPGLGPLRGRRRLGRQLVLPRPGAR